MATIKPFRAIRPTKERAKEIAALPYDVYSREEAREEIAKNPLSFLTVDLAETTMDPDTDPYADVVYERARENLTKYLLNGDMVQDESDAYYIYELTMGGRSQTGLVATTSVDEYEENVIKKHELTRAEKEEDRVRHVDTLDANTGPIFLTYRKSDVISTIIAQAKQMKPLFNFISDDGVRHRVWKVQDQSQMSALTKAFQDVASFYIADGHHRAASAVRVAKKRRKAYGIDPKAEYNAFLSVLFPDEELAILPYNRVVKDLNGLTDKAFLEHIEKAFDVQRSSVPVSPQKKGSFGMYLDGQWYILTLHDALKKDDPVGSLDVQALYDHLLGPVLGIGDPRVDARIDFVGGIRGLKELERRVSKDAKVAFSVYPTSIQELMAIADADLLMPPKSTWFEPKLRSGLFIHELESPLDED